MLSRSAIQASGSVVCERNFPAKSTFLGSPSPRYVRDDGGESRHGGAPHRIGGVPAGGRCALPHPVHEPRWLWTEEAQPACRECALRLRYNNSCGCLNWQTTGSVNAISPPLCHQEQMLMPIADRLGRELYRQRNPHFLHKHYNATYPVLSMMEDALSSHGKP